jgi:2'-5' RNA ligase
MSLLEQHYDSLWENALRAFQANQVAIDPLLASGQPDPRRGLTLIIRLDPQVRAEIEGFQRALRRFEPDQYYYPATDLHVTLLSLFTATASYGPYFARQAEYQRAVDEALRQAAGFAIHFSGVTASPDAIMIQGFPQAGALNGLRDHVREGLRRAGLGEGLDQRYRLRTAHVTVCRFRQAPEDLERFVERLSAYRRHNFGQTAVSEIQLVENDWCLTAARARVLKKYPLGGGGAPH